MKISTVVIKEVDLLRNGSGWNDWQNVSYQQVDLFSGFCLAHSQTDALAVFSVSSSAIYQWWVESVNVVVFAKQSEALVLFEKSTLSDGDVSAVVCLEILSKLIELRIAVLDGDDALFGEDDRFGPLE